MNRYLLDANVFIQAKNLHYGFDFCPAFWEWLEAKNMDGTVASIDKVEKELQLRADDLSVWVAQPRAGRLFQPSTGSEVVSQFTLVSNWADGQQYEQRGVADFLSKADSWLVAHGLAGGYTLVTHEVASNSRSKIKIPDACKGLGVPCTTPYQMLRSEGAKFVLPIP